MIAFIRNLFAKIKGHAPFPKEFKDLWYCGMWQTYREEAHNEGNEYRFQHTPWPVEGEVLFNHGRCDLYNNDKRGLVEGLIPAIRFGDRIGLYRVVGHRRGGMWYDGASWDDGANIDLEFVRTINELPDGWAGFDPDTGEK
jgi:hypothetical protein